jgi:hypothetical protein
MNARSITNIFAALALAFGPLAGLGCKKAVARSPAGGARAGTVYTNTFFGFSLPIPAGWSVASSSVTNAPDPKAHTFQLLLTSEKPLGTKTDSNPTLLVVVEKTSVSGAHDAQEYLDHITRMLSQSIVRQGNTVIPYATDGKIQPANVGGRDGARANLTVRLGQRRAHQSYFSTVVNGYAFSIVISAMNELDLRRLEEVVASASFSLQR